MQKNKSLPKSIDHEKSILASCMIYNDSISEISEALSYEDFYLETHKTIYKAIIELYNTKRPADLPTLISYLKSVGQLDMAGGAMYPASLLDEPVATNISSYCDIILDMSRQRQMIMLCTNTANECYNSDNIDGIFDSAFSKMYDIIMGSNSVITSVKELSVDFIDNLEKISRDGSIGIKTGFRNVDKLTLGFQNTDLNLIAARPGQGKSSLMLDLIENIASKIPVMCFSLEMSKDQLMMRLISKKTGIDLLKLRSGKLSTDDWANANEANSKIYEWKLYIDDTPALTITQIKQKSRQAVRKLGAKIIFIDYVQLVRPDRQAERRDLDIGAISAALKALAKELNLPVVALCQLNRKVDDRTDKRPTLSNLRESGSLEQDADAVYFIYHPAEAIKEKKDGNGHETDQYKKLKNIAEIIIAKQRNGPTGECPVYWHDKTASFKNYERGNYEN